MLPTKQNMGKGQDLLDAARKGDVEKLVALISKRSGPFPSLRRGAGVNVQDDKGFTPLHLACLQQHKYDTKAENELADKKKREIVRLLLSVDASPCIVDKAGATPLHYAAFNGNPDIVAMLLAHATPPVNVNHQTINLETPLLMAAPFGHVEVVQQLMAAGADVTLKNVNNETALDLAAQFGRTEVVKLLLRACPKLIDPYRHPNSTRQVFNNTPLHRASINGHKNIVSLLIEAGVDPNVSTGEGTPLHEAARFYRASVARVLLQHGADVRARGRGGCTVLDMLAGQPQEASRRVRNVIREFDTTEEETPCFPVSPTYPVAGTKAPDTQKNTNKIDSFLSPSSSSLTKKHPQSFVKKLAQKCLGFKSKFNSAPNICNTSGLESVGAVKYKHSDQKVSTNTLHIGNSKFFKMLLKKEEESGEINCTDEFDTISLDRLGTLNRDSVVNRSNRSCPGFKTSLPDIYENTEISDSLDSLADSMIVKSDCISEQTKNSTTTEAVNYNTKLSIFEPREISAVNFKSHTNDDCANFINECYESCEISSKNGSDIYLEQKLSPNPRPFIVKNSGKDVLYENVNIKPTPATRTHIPSKNMQINLEKNVLYENVVLKGELKPHPLKRTVITSQSQSENTLRTTSSSSISSSTSSDSMIDESNLEDILISERSKSFKHGQKITLFDDMKKSEVCRTQSNESILSDSSDVTQASALENVDCSEDVSEQNIRSSMTGTLPNKKPERLVKKKVLFRHKTFTNIEVDRNSLPKWNGSITRETLANYHIRGTGHCIFKAPTVLEFMNMFNKESLYNDIHSKSIASNTKRDSYFETVLCFCKLKPPKHHLSAEDLDVHKEEAKASIDTDALRNRLEIKSTSFSCYCDVGTCKFHSTKRASPVDLVVKFSAVKRSISTPDITLETSPSSTELKKNQLTRKQSVPYKLETPCTLSKVNEIVKNNNHSENKDAFKDRSVSHPSTISSTSSRPYSIKDIADVISLNSASSADPNLTCASEKQLPLRKTSSSEYSGQWSLQSCDSNVTIKSDASYKTCFEESSDDGSDGSEGTLQSDGESSDAETVTSDASTTRRPWVSSGSFRFEHKEHKFHNEVIVEEDNNGTLGETNSESYAKFESGISVGSESSSSACETDGGIPRVGSDVSLGIASLERGSGAVAGVRSGSGRRRWEEADGTSEGDALSISSAASSCAAHHLGHHLEYSKVSPTPPKKPPRRNLSVSPTHANSPSSGYSYELRTHARSQDDLDDIQGPKLYLKHGRSVDQYVDGKLSYSEYEENHNSPRIVPVPNPRSSLKNRTQPVAITAMYENVVIREQNPRRKLKRNSFGPQHDECDPRMNDNRVRKYSNQERSSMESLLDSQSMNSPSDCERYYEGHKVDVPSSPTHYEQPPTPDHPPPSAKQAENSIHERIRPLSQLIMEVVEEIRIRKKSQGDISGNS